MPSIFRSENVVFCQLIIPYETAYNVIRSIGELECVQFINKNEDVPAFSRKFTQRIMWCEAIERKLRFLEDELKSEKLNFFTSSPDSADAPDLTRFNELEQEITLVVDQLTQSNLHLSSLRVGYNELLEYRYVLANSDKFGNVVDSGADITISRNLTSTYGIISHSRVAQFEQFVWRAARGNVFIRHLPIDEEIQDPISGEKVPKCVFVLYTQGDQLGAKVKKICEAFQASVYTVPSSKEEREQTSLGLITRIKDIELVLSQTGDQRKIIFNQICTNFNIWRAKVLKIKAIFATLNQFSYTHGSRTPVAECWCPTVYLDSVRKTLSDVQAADKSDIPAILNVVSTNRQPPTYYILNKFTSGFQNLVDAYGVANYKEVNPSLYMIITFPFLFSVMFGDFGHSIFVLLVGLYMVLREKALMKYKNDDNVGMMFGGRYIVLLLGVFSLYAGLIYNDIFSKSVFLWPSSWELPSTSSTPSTIDVKNLANISGIVSLDPTKFAKPDPYPIGLDPIWMFSSNKITFVNSFKMKLSVILGFFQMLFGILLSAVNHCYFGHKLEFYAEFIPQLLFFISIFGYLVFLIFYKWIVFTAAKDAPSILLTLISMFMSFGKAIPEKEEFFTGQVSLISHLLRYVQPFLVVVVLLCVPWLLCVKPIILLVRRARNPVNIELRHLQPDSSPDEESSHPGTEKAEDEGAGAILIMQLIHTIEFVIGCISNMASYLRLWALSLAHNQLSELLWSMVLSYSLKRKSYFGSIILFAIVQIFLVLTILILVLMEGLSTFLHAIRLHWVEFQSKFYSGTGTQLVPFSLKAIVEKSVAY